MSTKGGGMEITEIKATKPSKRVKGKLIERLKVAAYCRVSTDNVDQLNSYDSQIKHYRSLISEKEEWHLVGIYADAAITGTQVSKRVDFQRIINDALSGDIDMIITKSISRFARNTYDTLKYVRMLKEKGVAVFFEEENINTLTMDGELLLTILSSVAQQEVENISENVKKGLKMKMKRGELVGFHGCLGYDYNKDDKTLTVNRDEVEAIRYIFERYVNGAGTTIISRELNERGIKTKKGNTWANSSVLRIIKNEKYIGDMLMGKTFTVDPISKRRLSNQGEEDKFYIKDHHEAIIDRDTFEAAQNMLSKRSYSRMPKGSNATREKYSRKYAFSSKLECGYCNSNLSRRSWHSGTKHHKVVWQCMLKTRKGKKYCDYSKGVPENVIEQAFMESYSMISGKDRDLVDGFVQRLESTLGSETISKKIKTINQKLNKLESKKKKLLDLLLDEKLGSDLFEKSLKEIEDEIKTLVEQEESYDLQLVHEKELKKKITTLKNTLNSNVKMSEFDRHIFESLIDKVIVGGDNEDGEVDPYKLTFIYKTGLDNRIDGVKFKQDGRKKSSDVLPSNSNNDLTDTVVKQQQPHMWRPW
jgi:DNA invertase Pin-like site-specific DNA recombinase